MRTKQFLFAVAFVVLFTPSTYAAFTCTSNAHPPPCATVTTTDWPNFILHGKVHINGGSISGNNENDDGSFTIMDAVGYFDTWNTNITATCQFPLSCNFTFTPLWSGSPTIGFQGGGNLPDYYTQKFGSGIGPFNSGWPGACTCNGKQPSFIAPWVSIAPAIRCSDDCTP